MNINSKKNTFLFCSIKINIIFEYNLKLKTMTTIEKFKKELKKDILKKAIAHTKQHCLFNGLTFSKGKKMNEVAIENLKFDFPELYKTYLSL